LSFPENAMRVASFVLLALVVSAAARAQGEPEPPPGGISDVISGSGFTKIKIAIPDPTAEALLQGMAKEIGQTIRDDLAFGRALAERMPDPSPAPLMAA